jgi:hypothetical protein
VVNHFVNLLLFLVVSFVADEGGLVLFTCLLLSIILVLAFVPLRCILGAGLGSSLLVLHELSEDLIVSIAVSIRCRSIDYWRVLVSPQLPAVYSVRLRPLPHTIILESQQSLLQLLSAQMQRIYFEIATGVLLLLRVSVVLLSMLHLFY